MAIKVETRDCTSLGDAELGDMADLCAESGAPFDVGVLSKHCEEWVLITEVKDGSKLAGFSFCTLERIGGTPCVLVGLAAVRPIPRREAVLKALLGDHLRRAVLAFPDEDVLVGTRITDPASFLAFAGLEDVVPRPGHKATGEERAWARRLAKRFGAEGKVNDRTLVVEGTGDPAPALEYEAADPDSVDPEVVGYLEGVDRKRGDSLIVFGWAMAEDLAARARK